MADIIYAMDFRSPPPEGGLDFLTTSKAGFSLVGIYIIPRAGLELELELIQTQMTQKPMLRAEVGMRVRCANKASAE